MRLSARLRAALAHHRSRPRATPHRQLAACLGQAKVRAAERVALRGQSRYHKAALAALTQYSQAATPQARSTACHLLCATLGDSLAQSVARPRPDCLSDTCGGIGCATYMSGPVAKVTARPSLLSPGRQRRPTRSRGRQPSAEAARRNPLAAGLPDAPGPAGRDPRHDPGHRPTAWRHRYRDPRVHR